MEPTIYKPSIYKGAGIYKTGAAGGGSGNVGIWENISITTSGSNGRVSAKINRATNEIQINVYGRNLSFDGNADVTLVTLPEGIEFDGLNMGMCWINNNRGQYNTNDLGIAKNSTISFTTSNNTLYGTFNTAGSIFSLAFRGIVKFV